jgi:hypothetical protein
MNDSFSLERWMENSGIGTYVEFLQQREDPFGPGTPAAPHQVTDPPQMDLAFSKPRGTVFDER